MTTPTPPVILAPSQAGEAERQLVMACPSCGEETAEFVEGFCPACQSARQNHLDEHNARFDWWESLTKQERDRQIRNAMRCA